jgi:hypothetical protein
MAGKLTGQTAFYRQIAQANQRYTDEIEPLYSQIGVPTLIVGNGRRPDTRRSSLTTPPPDPGEPNRAHRRRRPPSAGGPTHRTVSHAPSVADREPGLANRSRPIRHTYHLIGSANQRAPPVRRIDTSAYGSEMPDPLARPRGRGVVLWASAWPSFEGRNETTYDRMRRE